MGDYALLVGVDAYNAVNHPPLSTPVADVEAIAKLLRYDADDRPRWDAKTLVGAHRSKGRVTAAVLTSELKDRLERAAQESGHFFFYFAGHGEHAGLNGTSVVIQGQTAADPDSTVTLQGIVNLIHNYRGLKSTTVVLDCCYSGGAGDAPDFVIRGDRAILTSSRAGEEALEGHKGHSPFARYVIECLNGATAPLTGEVTITSLFEYVSRRFGRGDQRPQLKVSLATEPVVLRTAERLINPGNLKKLFPTSDTKKFLSWEHEGPVHLFEGEEETACTSCGEARSHHHARPSHAFPQLPPTEKQLEFDEIRRLHSHGLIHTRNNRAPFVVIQEGQDVWLSPLGEWYWHQRDLGWL